MRTKLGVSQIIVHGESIGGIVANHVGRFCKIDLLIVDRTFSNLNVVASHLIASWAGRGLQLVTG